MRYLNSLLYNFYVVFFSNYLIPGVDVVSQTKIPHLRGDLIFAVSLGVLNFLIVPVLRLFSKNPGVIQISFITLVLNYSAYGLLRLISIGVYVTDLNGYLIASLAVSVGSFLLSIFKRKQQAPNIQREEDPLDEFHPPHNED